MPQGRFHCDYIKLCSSDVVGFENGSSMEIALADDMFDANCP